MLPGLPGLPTNRDIAVVSQPQREIIEVRTDTERVLYIMEPVTVPDSGGGSGGGGGLLGYAETSPLTAPVGPAGLNGAWTLTPGAWRLTVPASVGDILEWMPNVLLGGGPAALDLVCLNGGAAIIRALSSGTSTPGTYGSMYTQGDIGTAQLPTLKWVVRAGEVVSAHVTLALAYRAAGGGEEGLALGVLNVASRIMLTNEGPVA
jgi:hypothetical protein